MLAFSAGGDDGAVRGGIGGADQRRGIDRRGGRDGRRGDAVADHLLVPPGPLRQKLGLPTVQLAEIPAHGASARQDHPQSQRRLRLLPPAQLLRGRQQHPGVSRLVRRSKHLHQR